MSLRNEHSFQFSATDIAKAAKEEAQYHEGRIEHWENRYAISSEIVKRTIGAKVIETLSTGNAKSLTAVIDYGDKEAWNECNLAFSKIQTHRIAAERYRTDEKLYGTQAERFYYLDSDDVHHFRLGGQEREQ